MWLVFFIWKSLNHGFLWNTRDTSQLVYLFPLKIIVLVFFCVSIPMGSMANLEQRNMIVFAKCPIWSHFNHFKGKEKADIWFATNSHSGGFKRRKTNVVQLVGGSQSPPLELSKCNTGSSWDTMRKMSGTSWIVRDHMGSTSVHSLARILM